MQLNYGNKILINIPSKIINFSSNKIIIIDNMNDLNALIIMKLLSSSSNEINLLIKNNNYKIINIKNHPYLFTNDIDLNIGNDLQILTNGVNRSFIRSISSTYSFFSPSNFGLS